MKIDRLEVGMVIKNYKELCAILEIEVKVANSRKAQLKELERYIAYHKEGQKIFIDEIYDTAKEKIDGRGKSEGSKGNNKVKYTNSIKMLILDMLAKSQEEIITISKSELLREVCAVNKSFSMCQRFINNNKLLNYLIEREQITDKVNFKKHLDEFFSVSRDMLKRNLITVLEELTDEKLIAYEEEYWIKKVSVNVKFDEVVDEFDEVVDYKAKTSNIISDYRKATDLEVQAILKAKREALDELKCASEQEVNAKHKWDRYTRLTNKTLLKEHNIALSYRKYKIIFNKSHVEKALFNSEIDMQNEGLDILKNLNSDIKDRILNNANNRQEKEVSESKAKTKYKYRKVDSYIKNYELFLKLFINIDDFANKTSIEDELCIKVKDYKMNK